MPKSIFRLLAHWTTLFTASAACTLLSGCSDKNRELSLLEAPGVPDVLSDEEERVRKMQMIRVFDDVLDEVVEKTPGELTTAIRFQVCGAALGCIDPEDCDSALCSHARTNLCMAKTLLALAVPQPTPIVIADWTVPAQSSATNAALAAEARSNALQSIGITEGSLPALRQMMGLSVPGFCSTSDADEPHDDGITVQGRTQSARATVAASLLADAYQTYKEATDVMVRSLLETSDAELSSTLSLTLASGRAFAGGLSRMAAAHALVKGDEGLLGDTSRGFCTSPDLSPDAKAALQVFRDSALSPAALLDETIPTETVLNATALPMMGMCDPTPEPPAAPCVPDGSVRQRWAELYGFAGLLAGQSLEEHFDLELAAFEEARRYMREEIAAFSRSMTAELPARSLVGGGTTTFKRFAATAGPPKPMPAAFYGAIARFSEDFLSVANPPVVSATDALAEAADAVSSQVAILLANQDDLPAAIRGEAAAPLALLASAEERLGRIRIATPPEGSIYTLAVHGFSTTAGLRVALGNDELRCAVHGDIEGAPCTLPSGREINLSHTPSVGFTAATRCSIDFAGQPTLTPVYVLRPRVPLATAPGQFEALAGVIIDQGNVGNLDVAIVPGAERRVADLIQPSRAWCTHPEVSCAGVKFDERMPLEDELIADGDGVESSWRHFLERAKEAAAEADALGVDYVNTGLQDSQRAEEIELRREEQLNRADAEIQNLQTICGTAMDTRKLLTLLTGDTESRNIVNATAGACSTDADCDMVDPEGGFKCVSGQCVVDLAKLAGAHANDSDIKRIADCLDENTLSSFVTLGTKPVCLWHDADNARLICESLSGQSEAPGVCPTIQLDGSTCDELMPPTSRPAGTVLVSSVPLGYFETDPSGGGTTGASPLNRCEQLRRVRSGETSWTVLRHVLTAGNFFSPDVLRERADRIDWEGRYGGYSAILVDGVPRYQTGSAWTGPPPFESWPCNPAPGTCALGAGFFCDPGVDCNNDIGRGLMNYQMLTAVLAAKLMVRPEDVGQLFVKSAPFFGDPLPQSFVLDSRSFWQGGHFIPEFKSGTSLYYDTTFVPSPANVGWYQGALAGSPGVWRFSSTLFGYSWDVRGGPAGYFLWGMYGPPPNPQESQKIVRWLSGQQEPAGTTLNVSVPPTTFVNLGGPIELSGLDFLNGLELLCSVAPLHEQEPSSQPVTLATPPTVNSIDDLVRVAEYVHLLGTEIRNRASLALFANVPSKAVDGLREVSASGAFPQFGGEMAQQLSILRGALLRVRETAPILANEIQQFGYDIEALHAKLIQFNIAQDISQLQLSSTITEQATGCISAIGSLSFGAGATCANSIAQINFANGIAELTGRSLELDADLAINDFGGRFSDRATNMGLQATRLAEAQEDVDVALAKIESLRLSAKSSIARALYLSSFQAEHEAEVTSVIGNLFAAKQIRYKQSLTNAKLLAFLAKRAIEQRLGLRLSTVTEDFPLVEAAATWEASVCTFAGIDYNALKEENPEAAQNFAGGFIGDYVQKLENFIESYRLQHNFHEGTDTAVVSLRDDVMNVRASCDVPINNLLFHTNDLRQFGAPGWSREDCPTEIVNEIEQPEPDCVGVLELGEALELTSPDLANTQGFELEFGAASTAQSAIVQSVDLTAGTYRFTWYTKEGVQSGAFAGGASAATLRGDSITITDGTDVTDIVPAPIMGGYNRRFLVFRIDTNQTVRIGFGLPASGGTVTVAAPMLEALPTLPESFALAPFVSTGETLTRVLPACEDTGGEVFRATRWRRDCVKLCADGFASNCSGERAQTHCFREAEFGVSQRAIQLGKLFNASGFARGNFNYRIESIGLNFVGTGIRDCASSELPSTCHAGGYVPYSLYHNGPFYVRNHVGDDFRAYLFDGAVEHARGLGNERYITNPLSNADRELIEPYLRTEFQGRPLDGNFVVRIWEEPGVDFEAIDDVQVVLNYRYWTRFN